MTPEYRSVVISFPDEGVVSLTGETQMVSLNETWQLETNNQIWPLAFSCSAVGVGNLSLSSCCCFWPVLLSSDINWLKVLSPPTGVAPFGARTVWRPLPVAEMVRKWLHIPLFLHQLQRDSPLHRTWYLRAFQHCQYDVFQHLWGKTTVEVQSHTLGAGLWGAFAFYFASICTIWIFHTESGKQKGENHQSLTMFTHKWSQFFFVLAVVWLWAS